MFSTVFTIISFVVLLFVVYNALHVKDRKFNFDWTEELERGYEHYCDSFNVSSEDGFTKKLWFVTEFLQLSVAERKELGPKVDRFLKDRVSFKKGGVVDWSDKITVPNTSLPVYYHNPFMQSDGSLVFTKEQWVAFLKHSEVFMDS